MLEQSVTSKVLFAVLAGLHNVMRWYVSFQFVRTHFLLTMRTFHHLILILVPMGCGWFFRVQISGFVWYILRGGGLTVRGVVSEYVSSKIIGTHLLLTMWTLQQPMLPMATVLRGGGFILRSIVSEYVFLKIVGTHLFSTMWTLHRPVFPMSADRFSCSLHISEKRELFLRRQMYLELAYA